MVLKISLYGYAELKMKLMFTECHLVLFNIHGRYFSAVEQKRKF